MDTPDTRILALTALVSTLSIIWLSFRHKDAVPPIPGAEGFFSSYVIAFRFFQRAKEVIGVGYNTDPTGIFRFPRLFRWDYVANGHQRVLEVANAPKSVLSVEESMADVVQADYVLGPEPRLNPYHTDVVKGPLTRNLGRVFARVRDELIHAFDEVLPLPEKGWNLVQIHPVSLQVVARASNRVFVDLPVCREPEFLKLCIDYVIVIFIRGRIMSFFPKFLRPVFAPLISARKSTLRHAFKFLGPVIDERLEQYNEHGRDWADKPNDLISWMLDVAAPGEGRTREGLAQRYLVINAAAIHTSSMSLTNALYDLVTYPEHFAPMREEAERVIAADGWTKAGLSNMHKIDSFFRESMRVNSAPINLSRKVVAKEGFTFSDGTTIAYGSYIHVPSAAAHLDQANYENPNVFDGFRFSRLREQPAEGAATFNRHVVSTATDFVPFGHGPHACPGRFFAAMQLKAMLAHILINYDIKAEKDSRPEEIALAEAVMPNPDGKIYIRRRV